MVRFSKFTLNINIYDKFVGFLSKLVGRETLFFGERQGGGHEYPRAKGDKTNTLF